MTSGIAIDCCGRELILERDTPSSFRRARATRRGNAAVTVQTHRRAAPVSCVTWSTPSRSRSCTRARATRPATRPTRMREGAELCFRPLRDIGPVCRRQPGGGTSGECTDGADGCADGQAPGVPCPHPDCPCGEAVPLALITGAGESAWSRHRRGMSAPAGQQLTHVTAINWPHGGSLTVDELVGRRRRLEVPGGWHPAQGDATGVDEYTFAGQPAGGRTRHPALRPRLPANRRGRLPCHLHDPPDYLEVRGVTRSRAPRSS